jgi:hypothetical protein
MKSNPLEDSSLGDYVAGGKAFGKVFWNGSLKRHSIKNDDFVSNGCKLSAASCKRFNRKDARRKERLIALNDLQLVANGLQLAAHRLQLLSLIYH